MIMKQVAGYIQRKTMLYETGVEYGDFTMNHVLGCAHGCLYPCYAFQQKKRFGQVKDYDDWLRPRLVQNTLDLLKVEIPKLRNKIHSVQLCFSTDPFMYEFGEICKMSMDAIELLNQSGIRCTVLTKSVLPIDLADIHRFPLENEYGITLITLNEGYREEKEPFAATCEQRLRSLEALHAAGRKTWVSIEPYPTPNQIEQNLCDLLEAISFTDKIIFGRTNYCSEVTKGYPKHKSFYNEKAQVVADFCRQRGIEFHIKEKTITE